MSFDAIRTSSVRKADLQRILHDRGCDWRAVGHITPAGALSKRITESDGFAVPIALLMDLIVIPGSMPPIKCPAPRERAGDMIEIEEFCNLVKGRRISAKLGMEMSLHRLRTGEASAVANSLWHGRNEFLTAIDGLVSSGFSPGDIDPQDDPLIELATRAWREIESDFPSVTAIRRDLWMGRDEFARQESDRSKDLRGRLLAALDAAFGRSPSTRTVVYHGFYYYTPIQWALFQLLRLMPEVEQLFVVHDDGECEAFESWRRYFDSNHEMPLPVPVAAVHSPTPMANALREGLSARRVDSSAVEGRLEIGWYADFAAFAAASDNQANIRLYSAASDQIEGRLERMRPFTAGAKVDLASLPAGIYLLRLHDCIVPTGSGGHRLVLTTEIVRDIVATGCLPSSGGTGNSLEHMPALMRALPFFAGCESTEDWLLRANHLVKLVQTDVARLGVRDDSSSDLQRIATAAKNHFARVPWCDLTVSEVQHVEAIICRLKGELDDLFRIESQSVLLERHFGELRTRLEKSLSAVSEAEASRIRQMLEGAGAGLAHSAPAELVVDLVRMLLGRQSELDANEMAPDLRVISRLRDLDSVGFAPEKTGLHIANLADGAFPAPSQESSWPFPWKAIKEGPTQSRNLIQLRSQTAMIGDLYLLWLGLDGVESGGSVRLSWIKDLDREPRNHSALLTLIAKMDLPREWGAVSETTGGVPIQQFLAHSTEGVAVPLMAVEAETDAPQIASDLLAGKFTGLSIDHGALSSAAECSRRFAIQWLLGPTSSYSASWLQVMAYGNILGALEWHQKGWSHSDAVRACRDLWRQFPPGALASSERYAVVGSRHQRRNASPKWLLTLRSGEGFEAAKNDSAPLPEAKVLGDDSPRAIPLGLAKLPSASTGALSDDERIETCKYCPVNERCLHRVRDEWY
jgi:hypothetical protein